MIDQVIILVGPGGEDHCAGFFRRSGPDPVKDLLSLLEKLFAVGILGGLTLPDRLADSLCRDPEGVLHEFRQLTLPVYVRVPEKDRHIVFDVPAFFGIIGVFDDKRESFDDSAHGDTGALRVLGFSC